MSKPRSDLVYLCRNLKAPSLLSSVDRLAERARAENWTHEEFLCACLEREVSSRQTHGGENRIKAARFPSYKTLEDFDFNHQRSVRKEVVAHLGALDFVAGKQNVVFLGPPGNRKDPPGNRPWDQGLPGRTPGGSSPPPPSGWRD